MGSTPDWRPLRIAIAFTLLLLSLQAWSGDFVNVFVTTSPATGVPQSVSGFFGAITGNGVFLLWHGMEGLLILVSAVVVFALSLRRQKRNVKAAAGLALFFVVVAGLGGYFFVLSGFSAGGSSMQMGGSFIGAYALQFIALWFTK